MKKILRLFAGMMVLMLCLTGCVRVSATINIKKNGKVDLSMIYAISDSVTSFAEINDGEGLIDEEKIKEYKDKGWNYEDYAEDGYTGYQVSKTDVNIKDLMADSGKSDGTGFDEFTSSSMFRKEGRKYILDFVPLSEDESTSIDTAGTYLSNLGGYVEVTVQLPFKPLNSNATEVSEDGRTLTWDLLKMKAGDHIHLEFEFPDWTWVWILCGVVLLAVFTLVYKLTGKKKQKKTQQEPDEETSAEPAAEGNSADDNASAPVSEDVSELKPEENPAAQQEAAPAEEKEETSEAKPEEISAPQIDRAVIPETAAASDAAATSEAADETTGAASEKAEEGETSRVTNE